MVDEDGFGPSKLTQQIYSLPPLATRELVHIQPAAADLIILSQNPPFVNPFPKKL